jgi:alpha-D-ribose 1-methylphosphonate 5-triphosphate synthase subunit PhnH
MHTDTVPATGFADPVHDAQRCFRAALAALSRPGLPVDVCGAAAPSFDPASPAATSMLLALTDETTAVWWPSGASSAALALRFHTGATAVAEPADAAFGVVPLAQAFPNLSAFAKGSDDFPERGATLFIEVESLTTGPRTTWTGPGIDGAVTVRMAGLPSDFVARWARNHRGFPSGVDVFFTCGTRAIGLPRSVRVA